MPVQVQMNYNAAHAFRKDNAGTVHPTGLHENRGSFLLLNHRQSSFRQNRFFVITLKSCFHNHISIKRLATPISLVMRITIDQFLIVFSVSDIRSVTCHAADNANGTKG